MTDSYMEPALAEKVSELIDCMVQTKAYRDYDEKRQKFLHDPALRGPIMRTHEIRQRLQDMSEDERNSDYADQLENEYLELHNMRGVYEYNTAEVEFTRMFQEMMATILSAVETD